WSSGRASWSVRPATDDRMVHHSSTCTIRVESRRPVGRSQVVRPGPAWDAMAVVSLLYFPMAVLAMGPYVLTQPTARFSAWPEDAAFRVFLESALEGRTGPYQAHLAAMVFHTLTGSLLMVLGPYLLWSRPRRRTRTHVLAGRL